MRVIGCGNRERGDDGAGILVAERLRELGVEAQVQTGEALSLIEAWSGSDDVIVIDAVMTGADPGRVHVWDDPQNLRPGASPASSHGLGVGEAIDLARALGRLPRRLRIYGIEARRFEQGTPVSAEIEHAAEEVAQRISRLVSQSPGSETVLLAINDPT
jgi:hydrogenase maturation protease